MTTEDKNSDGMSHNTSSGIWRTVWAIVFVVLSVEAIIVAAAINSKREINVTKPILRMSEPSDKSEFDTTRIDTYLSESAVIENTTLYFYKDSQPARNPQKYYDSINSDFIFLSKLVKYEKAVLPSKIYLFDQELDEYIERAGYDDGWITDTGVYLPAGRNAAKQLLCYLLDKKGVDYDIELIDGLSEFIGGFLDFYNDHPYESPFEKAHSSWQKNTPLILPIARVVLNDERLGADFLSIPVRRSIVLTAGTPQSGVLRTGFYRYLLDKYGWDGFTKLLIAGGKGDEPFNSAYEKPATDLLKDYQSALDLLPKDAYVFDIARLTALDRNLLKHSIADQVVADAEATLKTEVKRFKLPPRDLAQRNDSLGRIYLRKYFLSPDVESPQVKKLASDAEGILLSSNANVDALSEIEHKWLVARIYERLGDHEAADRLYSAGLEHPLLRYYYIPEYADILLARRNFQRVADVLEDYLQNYPNDLEMLYIRMACLTRLGKIDEAKAIAQPIALHPLIELGLHEDYKLFSEYVLSSEIDSEVDDLVNDVKPAKTDTDKPKNR